MIYYYKKYLTKIIIFKVISTLNSSNILIFPTKILIILPNNI